ncbi:hypothetical protein [Actinoallomurus sp. CA-150999]|uniref:hypothetical protein n=1 Tax=Actinoallomurus sp. CA-150999 TaxID=3239887 RepID=UPI003D8A9073
MATTILTLIGTAVLILHAAARLPAALADLLRSCRLVRDAFHELRTPEPDPPPATNLPGEPEDLSAST